MLEPTVAIAAASRMNEIEIAVINDHTTIFVCNDCSWSLKPF